MPPRQQHGEPVTTTTFRRMSDILICFSCCVTEQPAPRRRRIDRSMIGLPTNFIHTGHIGSGDMSPQQEIQEQNNHLNSIQVQMQSKGGYSGVESVDFHRNVIDVKRQDNGD